MFFFRVKTSGREKKKWYFYFLPKNRLDISECYCECLVSYSLAFVTATTCKTWHAGRGRGNGTHTKHQGNRGFSWPAWLSSCINISQNPDRRGFASLVPYITTVHFYEVSNAVNISIQLFQGPRMPTIMERSRHGQSMTIIFDLEDCQRV